MEAPQGFNSKMTPGSGAVDYDDDDDAQLRHDATGRSRVTQHRIPEMIVIIGAGVVYYRSARSPLHHLQSLVLRKKNEEEGLES